MSNYAKLAGVIGFAVSAMHPFDGWWRNIALTVLIIACLEWLRR